MVGQNNQETQIGLAEFAKALWGGKWIIIIFTSLGAALSVLYALNLPNIYRSEILLAPTESSSAGSQLSQLGSVAALAGINLNSGGDKKTTISLEILQSREFITNFIEKNGLLVNLFAVDYWDRLNNELVIDASIYNPDTKEWVREVEPPKQAKPSLQEAYTEFVSLFEVEERKESGTYLLAIEHLSPFIAKEWLDLIVYELNSHIKKLDIEEANNSLRYLNNQLGLTAVEDLKAVLYRLIEEQTKTLMLAQISDQYVFKVIDPPIASEIQHKPQRALICVVITLFFIILAGFVVLLRYFSQVEKQRQA